MDCGNRESISKRKTENGTIMKQLLLIIILLLLPIQGIAARKPLEKISRSPYLAAIALDADTGKILFEKNADTPAYPASVLKLMTLLIVLDAAERGQITLTDMVQITRESAQMGGSQVYLDPKEQFPVEELLYALMVQSANDAAMALAIHVAGSKTAFLALMNKKAKELGMNSSHFFSVHGLPPASGQEVDTTTARDLSLLCLALVKKPATFRYTATTEREFRNGQFIMRTHNHLLGNLSGCDGLKTGYFTAAGYSIAATAIRDGRRVIAIVLGSEDRKTRDTRAREIIEQGFANLPPLSRSGTTGTLAEQQGQGNSEAVQILESTTLTLDPAPPAAADDDAGMAASSCRMVFFYGFSTGVGLCLLITLLRKRKKRGPYRYTR